MTAGPRRDEPRPWQSLPAAPCLAFLVCPPPPPPFLSSQMLCGGCCSDPVPVLQGRLGPLLPRYPAVSHPLLGILPFSCCPASPKSCWALDAWAPCPPWRGWCWERSRNGRGGGQRAAGRGKAERADCRARAASGTLFLATRSPGVLSFTHLFTPGPRGRRGTAFPRGAEHRGGGSQPDLLPLGAKGGG